MLQGRHVLVLGVCRGERVEGGVVRRVIFCVCGEESYVVCVDGLQVRVCCCASWS